MVELALRVAPGAVEDVLDDLLALAPHGVHEVAVGDEIELRLRGPRIELPSDQAIAAAVGPWASSLRERELPDDWAQLRLVDYEPRILAERVVVRPDWAPVPDGGLVDVVLAESDAFGEGSHPTTQACLDEICALPSGGSFADLGCGSGVLAIAAARLGFTNVVAIEREPASADAARANVKLNDVEVVVREADLTVDEPPPAQTVVANVPPEVHAVLAHRLGPETHTVLVSGVLASAADDAAALYASAGFTEAARRDHGGWAVLRLGR